MDVICHSQLCPHLQYITNIQEWTCFLRHVCKNGHVWMCPNTAKCQNVKHTGWGFRPFWDVLAELLLSLSLVNTRWLIVAAMTYQYVQLVDHI